MRHRPLLILSLSMAWLLHACGTSRLSQMDDQGRLGDHPPVFPDPTTSAWQDEGSFPNSENLANVRPGVTKNQLYALLGRPHFQEGQFDVREWDYLFHFRTGRSDEVTSCQFKVIFDNTKVAREFYWLPADCGRGERP